MNLSEKRILVTGGEQFLGRRVVEALRERGCRRLILPRGPDLDLRHEPDVLRLFQCQRIDVVIHLAGAGGGIGAGQPAPGALFYDNAVTGIRLLEQARLHGVGKFVSIGTAGCYPREAAVPFVEGELWNGFPEPATAAYSTAKKMLLVQSQAYREEYGFNGIHLIPADLYGPGERVDGESTPVISVLIRKCQETILSGSDRIVLEGDGSATADFLHVEDAAEGIVRATERYDGSEPVNLGTGREISMDGLARLVASQMCFQGEIHWDSSVSGGRSRGRLNVDLARKAFGFSAVRSLEEGLAETVRWHLKEQSFAPKSASGPPLPARLPTELAVFHRRPATSTFEERRGES